MENQRFYVAFWATLDRWSLLPSGKFCCPGQRGLSWSCWSMNLSKNILCPTENNWSTDLHWIGLHIFHCPTGMFDALSENLISVKAEWIMWKLVMRGWSRSSADSRFVPSQWETPLLCNDVSHWLGANLESALRSYFRGVSSGLMWLCLASGNLIWQPGASISSITWSEKLYGVESGACFGLFR